MCFGFFKKIIKISYRVEFLLSIHLFYFEFLKVQTVRKNGLHFLFKEGDQILNRIFDEVADKETLNTFLRKTYGLLILTSLFSTLLVYIITKYMNDTYILVLGATSIILLLIASFVLSRLNMVSSTSFKVWLGIYSRLKVN